LDWDKADVNDTNLEKVAEILKRLEFNSLIRRMPKHMQIHNTDLGITKLKAEIGTLHEKPWPEVINIAGPVVLYVAGRHGLAVNR
jgi:hypothetical protein